MPWHSTWPLGSTSVKANRLTGQDNTTYTEVTLGKAGLGNNGATTKDHFWAIDPDLDGRHRFIQMPAFTVGGNPADGTVGPGMGGNLYFKTTNGTVQVFFNRTIAAGGVYQVTPTYLFGTVDLTASGVNYVNVDAVPANVYGEIFMYTTAQGRFSTVTGFFRSGAAIVESWALLNSPFNTSSGAGLKFANGADAVGLNIRARKEDGINTVWNYKIFYRAI